MNIHPYIAPIGGLRLDLPGELIADINSRSCRNLRAFNGTLMSRDGYVDYGDCDTGTLMLMDTFYDFDDNQSLFAVTPDAIYKRGGSAWASARALSGTATDQDFVYADTLLNIADDQPTWLMCNGVDPIQAYRNTGSWGWSDLIASSTLNAHGLVGYKSYLVLWDVYDSGARIPKRLRWSDPGDFDTFPTENYLDLGGTDWIKSCLPMNNDALCVLKERSIWLGYLTGDAGGNAFEFDQKISSMGCSAGKTAAQIDEFIIFLGWDDVYTFNGVDIVPAGAMEGSKESPVREAMFDIINPAKIENCFGFVVEEKHEYWLCIPTGEEDYATTAFVYNYDLRTWVTYRFANNVTSFGYSLTSVAVTIDEAVGTIDAANYRIDSRDLLASSPNTLIGSTGGGTFEVVASETNDDGVAMDSYFDTKDFNFTNLASRNRFVQMDVSFTGSGLDIYHSVDQGISWTLAKSLESSSNLTPQKVSFRTHAPFTRFRFQNKEADENFVFYRANIYWTNGGRV